MLFRSSGTPFYKNYKILKTAGAFDGKVRIAYVKSVSGGATGSTDPKTVNPYSEDNAYSSLQPDTISKQETVLDKYATCMVTDGHIQNVDASGSDAKFDINWTANDMTTGDACTPLMINIDALHKDVVSGGTVEPDYTIDTLRGPMTGIAGSTWNVKIGRAHV